MADGYPKDALGQLDRDQLTKQSLVELRVACRLNTGRSANSKYRDTKADLIYKRAFCNHLQRVHDCLFSLLYFPPPIWCTNVSCMSETCCKWSLLNTCKVG